MSHLFVVVFLFFSGCHAGLDYERLAKDALYEQQRDAAILTLHERVDNLWGWYQEVKRLAAANRAKAQEPPAQ